MSRSKGRQRWHCKACDKTSFGSRSRAEETIDWAQDQGGKVKPKRAYQCPYGNGYHLTKKEERV